MPVKAHNIAVWLAGIKQGAKAASAAPGVSHRQAAVHHDDLSGDIGGLIGGKETHRVGDFLSRAETPDRNVLGDFVLDLLDEPSRQSV